MSRERELLKKYSWLIKLLINAGKLLPRKACLILMKVIRSHDNRLAMLIRYICLKRCAKSCGDNVAVFSNIYLFNIHNLEIGDNVSFHPMCYINASGGIKVGNDVSIAHSSTIMSEEHKYDDLNKNIKDQGFTFKRTTIGDNVWIGAGARILGGSTINSGSIIASGAVVKGNVNKNTIVGGIPAKIIKERK